MDENCCFIDYTGNNYNSWDDFVREIILCYNSNGEYKSNEDLQFLKIQLKDNYNRQEWWEINNKHIYSLKWPKLEQWIEYFPSIQLVVEDSDINNKY